MEKILSIESVSDNRGDGFVIVTSQQELSFFIDNGPGCCEQWGHISSEDDFSEFIGATLLKVEQVDRALNVSIMKDVPTYDTGIIFINFATSEGLLQLAVYNSHNGYYGHSVKFNSEQLQIYDEL